MIFFCLLLQMVFLYLHYFHTNVVGYKWEIQLFLRVFQYQIGHMSRYKLHSLLIAYHMELCYYGILLKILSNVNLLLLSLSQSFTHTCTTHTRTRIYMHTHACHTYHTCHTPHMPHTPHMTPHTCTYTCAHMHSHTHMYTRAHALAHAHIHHTPHTHMHFSYSGTSHALEN